MSRIYCAVIVMAFVCSGGIVMADENPDATFYKKAAEGGPCPPHTREGKERACRLG